jgi:hypothetical protein
VNGRFPVIMPLPKRAGDVLAANEDATREALAVTGINPKYVSPSVADPPAAPVGTLGAKRTATGGIVRLERLLNNWVSRGEALPGAQDFERVRDAIGNTALAQLDAKGAADGAQFVLGSRYTWQARDAATVAGLPAANGRTVVTASDGGVWVREQVGTLSARLCGAVANGVADDLPALNLAYSICETDRRYHTIVLPDSVTRVSGPWLVGRKFIAEKDLHYRINLQDQPSFNAALYGVAKDLRRVSIIGAGQGSVLYGDFDAAELTAVLYYGIPAQIGGPAGPAGQQGSVGGFAIAGKGTFDAQGQYIVAPGERAVTNNLVGAVFPRAYGLGITTLNMENLRQGSVTQEGYWGESARITAWRCGIGTRTLQGNATRGATLTSWYCEAGHEVSGQGGSIRNLNTQQCQIDVLARAWDNVQIINSYCENENPAHTDYGWVFGVSDDPASGIYHSIIDNLHLTRRGGKGMIGNTVVAHLTFRAARSFHPNIGPLRSDFNVAGSIIWVQASDGDDLAAGVVNGKRFLRRPGFWVDGDNAGHWRDARARVAEAGGELGFFGNIPRGQPQISGKATAPSTFADVLANLDYNGFIKNLTTPVAAQPAPIPLSAPPTAADFNALITQLKALGVLT